MVFNNVTVLSLLRPSVPALSAANETVALEVRHYGEAPGKLALYDDDGETFDFEKRAFTWIQLSVAKDASGAWQGAVTRDANGRTWHYSDVKWTIMGGE